MEKSLDTHIFKREIIVEVLNDPTAAFETK